MSSPFKRSALSFNSPRSSPFRRPSSPSSPSSVIGRPSTPPSKNGPSPVTSPSKLKQSFTVEDDDEELDVRPTTVRSQTEPPPSIAAILRSPQNFNSGLGSQSDNLGRLPPQLLHSMREAFSVLDTNSTGFVTPASVQETFASLGLQENSNMAVLFPLSQVQQISLPQFLNQLANILVGLSPQQELLNAFSVFDDDDNGQIDVEELKDALLNTAPEPGEQPLNARDVDRALEGFTGRRVFARNAMGIAGVRGLNGQYHGSSRKNGDVFRYHEFVGNLTGGPGGPGGSEAGNGQAVQAR